MALPGVSEKSCPSRTLGEDVRILRQVKSRLLASIGAAASGAIGVLLYLGLLADRFAWYTNVAVVLTVLVAVPTVIGLVWIQWGLSLAQRNGTSSHRSRA